MKLHQFFDHHGIARNPFAEEDAQTDPVFQEHCIENTLHPTWDKIYGDPRVPTTSIVFGEKGSGKTAVCMQIAHKLQKYNEENPDKRIWVIHYDDFNHFLDRFRDKLPSRRQAAEKVLDEFELSDHMDAILTVSTTGLVDGILGSRQSRTRTTGEIRHTDVEKMNRHQSRDLLLLSACYDESTQETFQGRWHRIRQRLEFSTWRSMWDRLLAVTLAPIILLIMLFMQFGGHGETLASSWFIFLLLIIAACSPLGWKFFKCHKRARQVVRALKIGNRETGPMRSVMMHFGSDEIAEQPLPERDRTDGRYGLMDKLQNILNTLGFDGVIVLVDRVDEPHLITGSAELMKSLVWPMLDNKFLKHQGFGMKLMLPIELTRYIDREDKDFYERARLDKQNVIKSFDWSAESLHDVTNSRITACAEKGSDPKLRDLLSPDVTDQRLMEALRLLRVPRHLFKFMHRVCVDHCNSFTDQDPSWQVSAGCFESTLAVVLRDQDAYDRGLGAG